MRREMIDILLEGFSLEVLVARISLPGLIATMAVALVCATGIYFAYRFFYPGVIYSANFNLLIVLVTMITAMIIMTISSNIVLSLGMVGALSIVRFRTAVKDPLDVGFLFLGIGAGLTAGAGLYLIAVSGTILILLIFVIFNLIKGARNVFLLIVTYDLDADEDVAKITKDLRAKLKSKSVQGQVVELSLQLNSRSDNRSVTEKFEGNEKIKSVVLLEYPGENVV